MFPENYDNYFEALAAVSAASVRAAQ